MTALVNNSNHLLTQKLNCLKQDKFTGQLTIESSQGSIAWKMYFCLGRIVWANGGFHPHRAYLRALARICPQIKLDPNNVTRAKKYQCWRYRLLNNLLQKKQIDSKQFSSLVKTIIGEVIFDIIEREKTVVIKYFIINTSADYLLDRGLKISANLIDIDTILQKIQKEEQNWSNFCQSQDNFWSPNLAPKIKDLDQLKFTVNRDIYYKLINLIDGRHTWRDLAVKLDRDLISLTTSLMPYFQQGLLEIIGIPDRPESHISFDFEEAPHNFISTKNDRPLVACIDDSLQILKIIEQITIKKGCRFVGIQESIEATLQLIKYQPDLIFLDVEMPIVNGYTICQQLRRVPEFKNTPIVILTAQNNLIDRLKAKQVGASLFLTKPIVMSQIINAIENYLSLPQKQANKIELDADFIIYCQQELTQYIGPIATVICERTLAENPNLKVRQFIKTIAFQIPDRDRAIEFEQRLLALL